MKRKNLKIIKIILVAITLFSVIAVVGLSGCKPAVSVEETAASQETSMQETEGGEGTAAEETAAETTAEAANPDEIKGNINILTGLELSDSVLSGRPVAVMVENQPAARPQSGLTSADVVFEVIDEGGVTRFVSIFSSKQPDLVGPVRSTRPYYAEIAAGFDPIYIFWGTAPYFYILVERLGLDYLSPLGDDTGASSIAANFVDPGSGEGADAIRDTTRQAPHNAYIRIPRMLEIAQNQGYSLEGGQSPFHFKEDAAEADRGDIADITLNFSQQTFKAEFKYDSASNTYLRYIAGDANTDRETGDQVTVNNVIVLITDIKNSGDEAGHMLVRTTQSGDAYYFFDGNVIEGTWSRLSALEPFKFKDKDGKTVLINRGQTWVSVIAGIEQLEY